MANVGGREVNNNDLGVMAAGAAALVFSFLPFWGYKIKVQGFGGGGSSITAWHGAAWFGMVMLIAAAAVVAARVFADVTLPTLPVGWHVIVAALAVVGAVLVILRGLTYGDGGYSGVGGSISAGVRWGGYLLFLAAIAESVFAVLALRESGESLSFDGGTPDAPPS
jgi:hypothetical protein